jgi:hypothetical protein
MCRLIIFYLVLLYDVVQEQVFHIVEILTQCLELVRDYCFHQVCGELVRDSCFHQVCGE